MLNSRYGRRAERRISASLTARGASVRLSPGSRGAGATDIDATFRSGARWLIQSKAARRTSSAPRRPSRHELGRLKQRASRLGATPVIARTHCGVTRFTSARTGRKLAPPKRDW